MGCFSSSVPNTPLSVILPLLRACSASSFPPRGSHARRTFQDPDLSPDLCQALPLRLPGAFSGSSRAPLSVERNLTQSIALNVVCRSKVHGLVACGGEDGAVECVDMCVKSSVGRIDAVRPSGDVDQEVDHCIGV